MDNEHKQRLRRMQVEFIRNLHDIEDISDYLLSRGVFTRAQAEKIVSAGSTVSDKIRAFLSTITRCGPKAYDTFLSALLETNQASLADKMTSLVIDSEAKTNNLVPHQSSVGLHSNVKRCKPLAVYSVKSTPRGYILLVNVANFDISSGLSTRLGSSEDVAALQSLFTDLGYSVEVLLDPTSFKLESALSDFIKSPAHYSVDATGLIVMSHGVQDYIYTSDGRLYAINDILDAFTNKNLPALAGKPKFILFQACRGEEKDRGFVYEPNATSFAQSSMERVDTTVLSKNTWKCLPYMSDYIIAYSTLPGFVSWRSEKDGSWFIQTLVDVFRKYASSFHVLDLLTEVNRRLVEESQSREFKQITQQSHTLTRPFYLSTAETDSS